MKNNTKAVITGSLLILLLSMPLAMSAGTAGTSDDPLVTLSYINTTLKAELKNELRSELKTELLSEIKEDMTAEILKELTESDGNIQISAITGSAGFEVVSLTYGQKLRATGACEIILRAGAANAFVESVENIQNNIGLSDCTSGEEVLNTADIAANHLLIIPRDDGRGALVTSSQAYFMVRGDYEIV